MSSTVPAGSSLELASEDLNRLILSSTTDPDASTLISLYRSAKSGDVTAQRILGNALLVGALGLTKDASRAQRWLQSAAHQGDEQAKGLLTTTPETPVDGGGTETADDLLDPIMSRTKAQLEKDKIKLAKAMHGEGIPKRDEITAGKWQFVSLSKMAEFAEITKVIDLHQDGRCSGEFRIAKSGYATNLKVSGSWRYDGKKRLLGLDVQTALEGIGLPEWDNMSELVENMPLPAKFTKATADREEYAVLEGSEGDYLARDSNGQQWRLKRLG